MDCPAVTQLSGDRTERACDMGVISAGQRLANFVRIERNRITQKQYSQCTEADAVWKSYILQLNFGYMYDILRLKLVLKVYPYEGKLYEKY